MNAKFMMTAVLTGMMSLSVQAAAAPYCASVSHSTGQIGGRAGTVKVIAAKKAIAGWEARARKKFNEPTITWNRARRKSIKYKHFAASVVSARAKGTVCIQAARKPHRVNRKCPPNDFKCKANVIIYKKKFTRTPDGIKGGLNPQPEPPSKLKVQVRQ